jgi:signal transduction histidine kinase
VPRSTPSRAAFACVLACLPLAATAGDGPRPAPRLTRVKAIRDLSPDEAARRYPVRIRGTVTYVDESWPSGIIVHDGDAGQFVLYSEKTGLRQGDRVEVEGVTIRGGFAPNVQPERVRRLGRGALPTPKRPPYPELLTGRYDCEYVEVDGVGQRAWSPTPPAAGMFLEVAVDGGIVRASLWGTRPEDLDRFVDARLRLRGNVGALFGPAGQLRGVSLLAGPPDEVAVLDPPPDPFSLRVRPVVSLYRYSSGGEVDRRIRIRGVVTAYRPGLPVEIVDSTTTLTYRDVRHVLYVRDETGAARVETVQATPASPGDVVDVAGFPAVTPTRPMLRNAVFRISGSRPAPPPTALSPPDVVTPDRDAELVRTEARVLGLVAGPAEQALILQAGETPFEASLDVVGGGALEAPRPGSRVSVTGVYSYQSGPPPSFRLLLRSPLDVALVLAAPWWTTRHTVVVGALIALIASGAGLWVWMIAKEHRLAREQYRAILAERVRLARELHDTLEQGLAGIKLQLEAVAGSLEGSPETARRALEVAGEMLRYSMEEARRSVMDLRSQALEDRDLPGALAELARQMTAGTPLAASVRVTGAPRALDASQEHHLLRIGLEAVTNAVKHAGATRVEIELAYDGQATRLVVSDDGGGFPSATGGVAGEHFGLRGIRERVDKLGGSLRLDQRPEGGTRLAVTVPHRRGPRETAAGSAA